MPNLSPEANRWLLRVDVVRDTESENIGTNHYVICRAGIFLHVFDSSVYTQSGSYYVSLFPTHKQQHTREMEIHEFRMLNRNDYLSFGLPTHDRPLALRRFGAGFRNRRLDDAPLA